MTTQRCKMHVIYKFGTEESWNRTFFATVSQEKKAFLLWSCVINWRRRLSNPDLSEATLHFWSRAATTGSDTSPLRTTPGCGHQAGVEAPARTTLPNVGAADRGRHGLNANDAWRIAHDRKSWRALYDPWPVKRSTDWLTVIRREGNCMEKEIMQGTTSDQRRRGRPRTRWQYTQRSGPGWLVIVCWDPLKTEDNEGRLSTKRPILGSRTDEGIQGAI